MIRRFVNLVVKANNERCVYSLHRLDVAKHLFYPSTADAEAATAKEEDSHNHNGGGGGDKPRRPSRIDRLRRLPEPIVRFQQFRPSNHQYMYHYDYDDDDDVIVNMGPRMDLWSPSDEMFVLLSPRGRIFHATEEGHAVLYDAGDDDSAGSITTLPSLDTSNTLPPIIAIPIARDAADGKAEKESLYVMATNHGCRGHSFQVLHICQHPPKWEPLPPPPFADNESIYSIKSFTVVDVDGGTIICMSTTEKRTYCFDTNSHRWWHAGDWMLPFYGRAECVPELNACLGLRPSWNCGVDDHGQLCASLDLHAAVHAHWEPTLQHVWEDLSLPPAEKEWIQLSRRLNNIGIERRKEWKLLRGDLINMGGGRFCVAKVFHVEQVVNWGFEANTEIEAAFVVLTGVEVLRRDGESKELRMVKHKSKRYMFTEDLIQLVL